MLVPIKDVKSLVIAIKKMLEFDSNKVRTMAEESIKLAKEKYDVRKVNQNIIDIIN